MSVSFARCVSRVLGALLAIVLLLGPVRAEEDQAFGSDRYQRGALIGQFYDFKQDQKRQPTDIRSPFDMAKYYAKIEEFINRGYDEGVLSDFFRASRALYTTQIFIPHRSAKDGPRAFGVEDIVKPSLWLAHYKGQVIPPEPGTYELVAAADGFIAVAVNGESVLVKYHGNNDKLLKQVGGKLGAPAANGRLRASLPFESDGKTPIDLDVLLAEAGGEFNAFLLYRREGEVYPKDANGNEILPVLQLAPRIIPDYKASLAPNVSPTAEYWQAVP